MHWRKTSIPCKDQEHWSAISLHLRLHNCWLHRSWESCLSRKCRRCIDQSSTAWCHPSQSKLSQHKAHFGLRYEDIFVDSKIVFVALVVSIYERFLSPIVFLQLAHIAYAVLLQLQSPFYRIYSNTSLSHSRNFTRRARYVELDWHDGLQSETWPFLFHLRPLERYPVHGCMQWCVKICQISQHSAMPPNLAKKPTQRFGVFRSQCSQDCFNLVSINYDPFFALNVA